MFDTPPQARNPGHALKQDIMNSLHSGNNRNAILGILRAMEDPADDYHVIPLLRKVLRKLKSDIPAPSTEKSWVSKAAGVVKISYPPDVLVGQGICFHYHYRNPESEKVSRAWKLSNTPQDEQPLEKWQGASKDRPVPFQKDLERVHERQYESAKRAFYAKDAERLFFERAESNQAHPPGDWIAICRAPFVEGGGDGKDAAKKDEVEILCVCLCVCFYVSVLLGSGFHSSTLVKGMVSPRFLCRARQWPSMLRQVMGQ